MMRGPVKAVLIRVTGPSIAQAVTMGLLCSGVVKDHRLIEAAHGEDVHVVAKLIVDRGTSVTDELGMNPLMIGAARGNIAMVYLLLKNKAFVNARDNWRNTAVVHAASSGHVFVVWLLLKWGADPRITNKYGESAMTVARANGHNDVLEFLRRWEAREPFPIELVQKFERKLERAVLAVKRGEAGVKTHPRKLRRLAWKAGVDRSSLFVTAGRNTPALKTPGTATPNPLSTEFLLSKSPVWPPYRPPPGKLAPKNKYRSVVPLGL